jgi:hypothetical protein
MVSENQKAILASAKRLRGASPDEIAADLGAPVADVVQGISELASRGYVSKLTRGVPVAPNGSPRFSEDELRDSIWELTFRGSLELSS